MISLSLCMIVKNEEAVLERILKPVSQMMDAILIADTGSSDRTKEIAEQYTSQVFDFPWCDDFSAPRNFLLEKVRTDYWMWLDADDVLDEENLEKLKSLKETLDSGTDVVMMEYAVGFDQSGRTTFSYFRERIMKTSRNFRQRQALTLLMATMNPPKLLLLDEHTAALDPGTAEKVLNLTRRIVEENQLTCLMITHNMQSAIDLGNRILMMDSGNIVLDIGGEEKKDMTVDGLLEKFKTGVGKALDNDRILLSE